LGDPRGLNFARGGASRKVVTFKNGDAIVTSSGLPDEMKFDQKLVRKTSEMDPENLDYLRYIISLVDSRKINLILLIEPRHFDNMIIFNEEEFLKEIGGKHRVIFNNNFQVKKKFWADNGHFNQVGIDLYTQLLACQIKADPAFSEKLCQPYRDKLVNGI
jgi:hypothetical protein